MAVRVKQLIRSESGAIQWGDDMAADLLPDTWRTATEGDAMDALYDRGEGPIQDLTDYVGWGRVVEIYVAERAEIYSITEYEDVEACAKRERKNAQARARRRALRDAADSVGVVRVKGQLGGVYYE